MNNLNENYGKIHIKLSDLLVQKGLNKNQLSHKAEMSWSQINHYCDNSITRLDTLSLCKLCTVLDCRIEDLVEFVPWKPTKEEEQQ